MSINIRLMCAGLCALALVFCACHEEKDLGSPEIFQQNATKLYFGDCDPFTADQEATDLVFDANDACTIPIEFYWYSAGSWYSNTFRVQPGTYYEGCHLAFTRDQADVGQAAVFRVTFTGLAVQFTGRVEIPVGQTIVVTDLFEQGTVTLPADSLVKIFIQINDSTGHGRLITNFGTGSYVMTGADQGTVCRFEINLGLAQGLGHPNQGVTFSYANAAYEVVPTLAWDFTGGASLLVGPVLLFGPKYGVAYLTAQSGGCCDTASFWALPGIIYDETTIATLSGYALDGFVSDGDSVWLWGVVSNTGDSLTPYQVRVSTLSDTMLFTHPLHTSSYITGLFYDHTNNLIWIVQGITDTAWGYTTTGVLDTLVSFNDIPGEGLYRGRWLRTTGTDRFYRETELLPLTGGSPVPMGTYPIELSRSFSGGAGVGYPGFANEDLWTINIFDSTGQWIARQPIHVEQNVTVYDVRAYSSDRSVVYALYGTSSSIGTFTQVRTLHP